jgi:hypothetical protein
MPQDVAHARAMSTPSAPKLLGPATSPVGVSGTIVPDLQGAIERDYKAMQTGPRQLTAGPQPQMGGTGIIVPGNVAPRGPYYDANGRPVNQGQLPPAPQPTMGGTGTLVPGNTSLSPRGIYGQPQLPAPAPGEPPINILPTGPGSIGPAGTVPVRSSETPRPAEPVAKLLARSIVSGGAPTPPSIPPEIAPAPPTQKRRHQRLLSRGHRPALGTEGLAPRRLPLPRRHQ